MKRSTKFLLLSFGVVLLAIVFAVRIAQGQLGVVLETGEVVEPGFTYWIPYVRHITVFVLWQSRTWNVVCKDRTLEGVQVDFVLDRRFLERKDIVNYTQTCLDYIRSRLEVRICDTDIPTSTLREKIQTDVEAVYVGLRMMSVTLPQKDYTDFLLELLSTHQRNMNALMVDILSQRRALVAPPAAVAAAPPR
jgi:hypothetical protein